MARKVIQTKATTLVYGINAEASQMRLANLLKLDGSSIQAADIGDILYGTYDPGTSREEIFSISSGDVTVNSDGTIDIVNIQRGLKEVQPYGAGGFAIDHPAGAVVIFGNNPQLYNELAFLGNDNTFTGFNEAPDPLTPQGLVTRDYMLALINGGPVTTTYIVVPGTAGETLVAGNLIYYKNTDGRWYKTDADDQTTLIGVKLGIAQGAATVGNAVTGGVMLYGDDTHQSGMTVGAIEYASNVAGGISEAPGSLTRVIGVAKNATAIHFDPYFDMPDNGRAPIVTDYHVTHNTVELTEGFSMDTEYNITNPTGTTMRYTYTGSGFDPDINPGTVSVDQSVHILSDTFDTDNSLDALVTGVGSNWFEIDNASGVPEIQQLGHGNIQFFNSFHKQLGLRYIRVRMVGGGGAGGSADGASTNNSVAAGGGAGAYTENFINAEDLDDLMMVIIGDQGLYSLGNSGSPGEPGSDSHFGPEDGGYDAPGGGGGSDDQTIEGGFGGEGGVATSGDINIQGANGYTGVFTDDTHGIKGGNGGASFFGGGEDGGNIHTSGSVFAPGAGGAGAFSHNGNPTFGRLGASGKVIIEEYF